MWKCIGDVVASAAKKHGRWITNVFDSRMPRLENTAKIDPQVMRQDMRDGVKRYFEQLGKAGKFEIDDPYQGLAGTDLLPWLLPPPAK